MGFTHLISSFLDFFDGNETTAKDTDLDSDLAEQTDFLQGLAELETLEKEVANYTEPEQTVSDKAFCDACGAPLSLINGCCAYCGTRYGASAASSLPASSLERELLVRQKASEVYDLYEEYALSKQNSSDNSTSGGILSDLLSTLLGADTEDAADLIRMSETDLVKGAAHYGVSLSAYISGIAKGTMKTTGMLELEEQQTLLSGQSLTTAQQQSSLYTWWKRRQAEKQREREQQMHNRPPAYGAPVYSAGRPDYHRPGQTNSPGFHSTSRPSAMRPSTNRPDGPGGNSGTFSGNRPGIPTGNSGNRPDRRNGHSGGPDGRSGFGGGRTGGGPGGRS
ncbi:MAG: hypothetical protein IJ773_03760 [Lachnospiraceae bacterium]|nr:hypothetical protein [Lachnospiraceae bacterium]